MPTEQTNIAPGEIIEGKVQGITNFGAFIELSGGMVGLVHISEIADTYVKEVKDFIKEGDMVRVKVLNVAGKKIGLSIKQAKVDSKPNFIRANQETTSPSRVSSYNKPPVMNRSNNNTNKVGVNNATLDDKIAKFLKESDERMQPLKNKIEIGRAHV